MPLCFPNGSSYWIPTQKPGASVSALPTNFTIPLFAPGSTSHLSPTYDKGQISKFQLGIIDQQNRLGYK